MAIKNRKSRKYRGSRTCGGGNAKMRRGAGHRGGRGNAGIKKHNKTWYLTHDPSALVSKGPGRPDVPRRIPRAINIGKLEEEVVELLSSGKAKRTDRGIILNLTSIGYDKLLGGGLARNPWVITAEAWSEVASRKIEEAGGQLLTPETSLEADNAS